MPLIRCDCMHLIVCAHRSKIELAFKTVICSTSDIHWERITLLMNSGCPYRKREKKQQRPFSIKQSQFSREEIKQNITNSVHPMNSPCIGEFNPNYITCEKCELLKECTKQFGWYYE